MKQFRGRTFINYLPGHSSLEGTGAAKYFSPLLLTLATCFFATGFYSYRDLHHREDSFAKQCNTATAEITNWKTETTTERGGRRGRKKTYTTQIIDYNFVTEDNRLFSGRDIVDTWKDKPVSYSGIRPSNTSPIEIEYLRSDPTTSRIAISNRNSSGYSLSVLSMIIAVVLFAIPCINALPKMLRLLTYGSVFAIVGLTPIAMGVAAPYFIFSQSAAQDNPQNDPDLVIWLIIGCSSFLIALGAVPFWLGLFLITRCRMLIDDYEDLLDLPGMPRFGDRITIMPRHFYFTDAAIIIDHQNQAVSFYNCHVRNGFFPWPLAIHSCDIRRLKIEERKRVSKGVEFHDTILGTSVGKTTLSMNDPAVNDLLLLLRYHH